MPTIAKTAFVEHPENICGDAQVLETARVFDGARVLQRACVAGNAYVYDHVQVRDEARVCHYACITDDVDIKANAFIGGTARVRGNACLGENANVLSGNHVFNGYVGPGYTWTLYRCKHPTGKVYWTLQFGCTTLDVREWLEPGRLVDLCNRYEPNYADTYIRIIQAILAMAPSNPE